ncbi:vacuolar fusion protein MON1 homolog B isoform X3 [Hoplias malabaricus]|uniref:vacuolar fusion protein MON1 homolog B isoform X3 n=1 Tax=Hoplias malabaricus TaxID=27720 RepID=UPI0034637F67
METSMDKEDQERGKMTENVDTIISTDTDVRILNEAIPTENHADHIVEDICQSEGEDRTLLCLDGHTEGHLVDTTSEDITQQGLALDAQKREDLDLDKSLSTSMSETDSGKVSEESALGDNGPDDSGEFVVAMLARGKLEEQGMGLKGASSPLSEAGTTLGASSHCDEDVTTDSWRQHHEHTVVFMQQGPLVLVSVSSSHQSEQQLRDELLYVYNQIVSMLTQASITRIFEHKKNYDLRRLLAGSEKILDGLLNLVDSDPSFLLSAVHCLPISSSFRDSLSQILQKAITPNLVFSILIAKKQLLTIVQEKMVIEDARLDPADLHLLLNLIGASSAFQAGEIWTPICLPSFNPDCYFYAYISYLDPPDCTVCLLLLSTDKEAFYAVADCKRKIEEAMLAQNALSYIAKAQSYSVSQVGVSDLRHFMYKPFDVPDNHRQLTQFTSPDMEAPYSSGDEKLRLLDLYRDLHSRIHNSSRPLKLIYHVAERETLLAWVTSKFELYTCFSPLVTKACAINAITKLLRWVKKEEDRLFIRYPPKYSTTPNPKSSRGKNRYTWTSLKLMKLTNKL